MDHWLEHFAQTAFRRSSDTAHDLKTPLNVAVLNLELLRMRISKLAGCEDQKLNGYAKSIEQELRRMAHIFDTFFILSTPPKDEGEPCEIDLSPLCSEAAGRAAFEIDGIGGSFMVHGHESRVRHAFKMFFEGAPHALIIDGRQATVERAPGLFTVVVSGRQATEDVDLTKAFKFYNTDALGNADLSLAAARLISETYGGELNALEDRDKVALRLSFPGE